MRIPFMVWLCVQADRRDPVGDLARDAKRDLADKGTQYWQGTEWGLSSHQFVGLLIRLGCYGARHAGLTARREYLSGVGPSSDIPSCPGVYCISYGAQPDMVKIGRSDNIKKRLTGFETGAPGGVVLRKVLSVNPEDEGAFHERYAKYRANGEWFFVKGQLEKDLS